MIRKIAILTLVGVIGLAGTALATPEMIGQDEGVALHQHMMYDRKTVQTIAGEVVSVKVINPMMKDLSVEHEMMALHKKIPKYMQVYLLVKTARETITVYLGPDYYIKRQAFTFAPKDKVEITGSRVTMQGKPVLLAAKVKKGGKTLQLRDGRGTPRWGPALGSRGLGA